jgi:hypothetical protein
MNEDIMGKRIVEAQYHKENIPEYDRNPLIAALPKILEFEEADASMHFFPEYHDFERGLPAHKRFHLTNRLFRFFLPWDKHYSIERKISIMLRQGYLSRNPIEPSYAMRLNQLSKCVEKRDINFEGIDLTDFSAEGFAIIGFSGVGKSKAVQKVLSLYPQVITHKEFEGHPLHQLQVPYIKQDCPPNGSLKGLLADFFLSTDKLTGDKNYKKFASRTTLDLMITRAALIASDINLGMLVIDEIQHLSTSKGGGSEIMLNFFVNLVNSIGIPVLLIGTNKALPIFQGAFRQARRSSGMQGDLIWENMKNDFWWENLIKSLWKYQWTTEKAPYSDEWSKLFYEKSMGIVDIAVKLFVLSQIRAIVLGKETITPMIVNEVTKDGLSMIEPMLQALRSGDKKKLRVHDDLLPLDIEEYRDKQLSILDSQILLNKLKNQESSKLSENKETATKMHKEIIKSKKSPKGVNKSSKNNSSGKINNDFLEILELGKKRGESAYDSLKQTGIILDFNQYFLKKDC